MWNSLPSSVVSSKNTEEFKDLILITGTEECVLACLCSASFLNSFNEIQCFPFC